MTIDSLSTNGWKVLIPAYRAYCKLNSIQPNELIITIMNSNARKNIRPWIPKEDRIVLKMGEVNQIFLQILEAPDDNVKYQSLFVLLMAFVAGSRYKPYKLLK